MLKGTVETAIGIGKIVIEMKKAVILTVILILVGLAACTPAPVKDGVVMASGKTLQSDRARLASPRVDRADQTTLAAGNGAFAFDLYQELKAEGDNLFYSPYSISAALAMTYAGARGQTGREMADALNFDLTQDQLHPAFNWLGQELASRGEGAEGKDDRGFRLNVVNAIWGQKDFEFMVDFLDTLAENYGAGLRILDFIKESEKSRITINDWVSDQTEDRIKDLIPRGAIDAVTRLVLTNAIYFNAAWEYEFRETQTADRIFHLLDGGTVTVPLMLRRASFGYAGGANYQAVEMPYDGRELSMVILLPAEGHFNEFEDSLDFQQVEGIINKLTRTDVNLRMPKFEFDSSFRLVEALSALGMRDAFSLGSADFTGMTGNRDLFIGEVIHKAFVAVDEEGTEAAAATAVIMPTSAPPQEEEFITVIVDRPFIFLSRDIETGAILFLGRVVAPSV